MSRKKSSISLNCSLTIPTSTMTTPISGSATPNTPEILNAIINISSPHLERITASEIQLKTEETNENELVPPGGRNGEINKVEAGKIEPNNINKYHSQFIREGLKMKVKQKIKEETFQSPDISFDFDDTINDRVSSNFILSDQINHFSLKSHISSPIQKKISQ